MDEHIGERVSALEKEVAVIKASYVRRDEFAETRVQIDKLHTKTGTVYANRDTRADTAYAELNARIDRFQASILKWTFAMQFTFAALIIAVIKYL